MDEKFSRYGTAEYLHGEEDMALYLDACQVKDFGDGSLIRTALGVIARAKTAIKEIEEALGVERSRVYREIRILEQWMAP